MIAGSKFTNVFGLVPAGDDRVARVAVAAAKEGWAVVAVRPGTRAPMCTLTARQAAAEDRKVRAAALDAGDKLWERRKHPCGIAHAMTDPAQVARVFKRLGQVNLGLELGLSRLVCVDVDTADEMAGFLREWSNETGKDEAYRHPTVKSPGAVNQDGTWVHKDGGHFWFTLPEGLELPTGSGVLKATSGWSVMWAGRQVLVPPSSRPEGNYQLIGMAEECPSWILDRIMVEVESRRERMVLASDKVFDSEDPLERWSAVTAWSDLLLMDDWQETGLVDTCSCPIWTAPGVHASPKSATAHDLGCTRYNTDTGWGPLHVWTDNPPEWMRQKTYTKVQYLADRDYQGDSGKTLQALEINPSLEFPGFDLKDAVDDDMLEDFDSAGEDQGEVTDPVDLLIGRMLSSSQLDSIPDPEPLITGLLDKDALSRMVGKSGHGKTFLMIDIACCIGSGIPWHGRKTAQGRVVYMVAEGARGFKKRIRAWERRNNKGVCLTPEQLMIIPFPIQATDKNQWRVLRQALIRLNPLMVVFDTQARITVGVNENDATEMGVFIEKMEQVRRETQACCVLVHHLGHHGDQGRGSSAVIGAINTEIRVTKERSEISIWVDKQKDEKESDPVVLTLDPEGNSAVLTGKATDDPFMVIEVGPDSPADDRLALLLDTVFPAAGATKAELYVAVRERDKGPTGKPMNRVTFYRSWDKLVGSGQLCQIEVEGRLTQRYTLTAEARERRQLCETDLSRVRNVT